MKIEQVLKTQAYLPLTKQIVLNILFTQHVVSDQLTEVCKAHELSVEQYNVLRILRGQKNKPVAMHCIQERMIAPTSNTTRLVDKLVVKKLATRALCVANRRKMDVQITAKGCELLAIIDPEINQVEQKLAANLSENELIELNSLLEKYRDNK